MEQMHVSRSLMFNINDHAVDIVLFNMWRKHMCMKGENGSMVFLM